MQDKTNKKNLSLSHLESYFNIPMIRYVSFTGISVIFLSHLKVTFREKTFLPRAVSFLVHCFILAKFAGIPFATVAPKHPDGVFIRWENAKMPT